MTDLKSVKSETLKNIYSNKTVESQREIYRDWADTYDEQTRDEFGWMGFKPAAEEFAKRVTDKNAFILDAGCGTGLSGIALKAHGFTNIEGRDLSPEMLAKAEETGAYVRLAEVDLTNPLEVDERFDAVFSSGVFGFGIPGPEHLHHLINVVKPGGLIILTVNGKAWAETEWEKRLGEAVEANKLNLAEVLTVEYLEKEEINGKLLIFRA